VSRWARPGWPQTHERGPGGARADMEDGMGIGTVLRDAARGVIQGERPDGELIRGLHPYRRLMTHIMQGRNESIVFYDTYAKADALLEYIEEANQHFHVDVTHCLVAAAAIGLSENPRMNRFVVGRRLYQRRERQVTFSMKRKKLGRDAKLAAVKMTMRDGETFRELCERVNAKIQVERSDAKTYADKELDLLNKLPRSALDVAVKALKVADHYNLIPKSFLDGDGMYTSMFIANLGSVGMEPGFHHLYEWGNCPLFMMAGKIEKRPVVVDDKVVVQRVLPIRWSYDERIDDGLNSRFGIEAVNRALENPREYFGCLADDGSDCPPLSRPPLR